MPFLPLALESIANQSYTNHKILAWDDCSTDESLDELQRWIPDRIPGRIFSGKSLRLGACLAFLVEQADTELCARLDGDDVAYPYRLQSQAAYMVEHPEVALLGGQAQTIDGDGKELPSWDYPIRDADARWLARYTCTLAHSSLMFRRSAILAAGNYPRAFEFEDAALWIRMSVMNFEFHNLPENLIKYRRTNVSLTGLIEDWLATNRGFAKFSASIMFPGIPDPVQAMELWEATHPHQRSVAPKLWHLKALDRAAVAHARLVGKADDYFLNCDAFKEQRYLVRRDILRRFGLGPLVHLRERLARKQRLSVG
jgi:glycosyltransferase involved in cell wall biosynthesis